MNNIDDQKDYLDGKKIGSAWAEKKATEKERKRLKSLRKGAQNHWDECFESRGQVTSADVWIALEALGWNCSETEIDNFWKRAIGQGWNKRRHSAQFVKGFAEGALEFWKKKGKGSK